MVLKCVCVFMCVRERGREEENREREIETKNQAHMLCDDRWRPILPISGSQSLENLKSKEKSER